MANVAIVVNRYATNIQANLAFMDGFESLLAMA